MTKRMTATEVRAKFHSLLNEVAAGEVVEITKRGRLVARLLPARDHHRLKRGACRFGVADGAR